jgi:hypothetical protein
MKEISYSLTREDYTFAVIHLLVRPLASSQNSSVLVRSHQMSCAKGHDVVNRTHAHRPWEIHLTLASEPTVLLPGRLVTSQQSQSLNSRSECGSVLDNPFLISSRGTFIHAYSPRCPVSSGTDRERNCGRWAARCHWSELTVVNTARIVRTLSGDWHYRYCKDLTWTTSRTITGRSTKPKTKDPFWWVHRYEAVMKTREKWLEVSLRIIRTSGTSYRPLVAYVSKWFSFKKNHSYVRIG